MCENANVVPNVVSAKCEMRYEVLMRVVDVCMVMAMVVCLYNLKDKMSL